MNKSVEEGNKNYEAGVKKMVEMEEMVPKIHSEADLESARAIAKECMPLLDKARDAYKAVGDKFTEASNVKINDKLKEYYSTKGKKFAKRSEMAITLKEEPQALIDSKGKKEYEEKAAKVVEKVKALQKEADELAEKAKKIESDNKDIIKS